MARGKFISRIELERIKLLKNQGLSVNAIAVKMQRSRNLINKCLIEHRGEVEAQGQALNQETVDVYNDIIMLGLAKLKDEVDDARVRAVDRAKIIGILFDKRQLLIGRPTAIEENNVTTEATNESSRIVAAFTEFALSNDSSSEEGNRLEEPTTVRPALPAPSIDVSNE